MQRKHAAHFLYVNGNNESAQAIQIFSALEGEYKIKIIDESDEPQIPELPKPRMITPEGRYTTLEAIQEYVNHHLDKSKKLILGTPTPCFRQKTR